MKRLTSILNLLRKGAKVADPALWKTRQVTATAITAVLWGAVRVAETYGVEVPVNAETVDAIAVVLLAAVNGVLTYTTSDTVGLPPADRREPVDSAD